MTAQIINIHVWIKANISLQGNAKKPCSTSTESPLRPGYHTNHNLVQEHGIIQRAQFTGRAAPSLNLWGQKSPSDFASHHLSPPHSPKTLFLSFNF